MASGSERNSLAQAQSQTAAMTWDMSRMPDQKPIRDELDSFQTLAEDLTAVDHTLRPGHPKDKAIFEKIVLDTYALTKFNSLELGGSMRFDTAGGRNPFRRRPG